MSKFNPYKFMNSACSKDVTRYFMMYCWYDKDADRIVSTDGHQLHMWNKPPCNFPESTYVALDEKAKAIYAIQKEGQYPNYKRVIPEEEVLGDRLAIDLCDPDSNIPIFLAREGIALDLRFLKNLQSEVWSVRFNVENKPNKPAVFEFADYVSVIMPLMLD